MPVDIHLDASKKELQVKVSGRFDFSMHQDFRKLSEQAAENINSIIISWYMKSYNIYI